MMVMPMIELCAIPHIARDPEHHYALAQQNMNYVVNYAIANGFDKLVRTFFSKLTSSHIESILKGFIKAGRVK